jgi:hypothetical protein
MAAVFIDNFISEVKSLPSCMVQEQPCVGRSCFTLGVQCGVMNLDDGDPCFDFQPCPRLARRAMHASPFAACSGPNQSNSWFEPPVRNHA